LAEQGWCAAVLSPGEKEGVRRRFALTPALSPGERENFRTLFESSMAPVASVAFLPFRERGRALTKILEECRGFFSSVFRAPKTPKFFPLW
jgi:hypothetical protein